MSRLLHSFRYQIQLSLDVSCVMVPLHPFKPLARSSNASHVCSGRTGRLDLVSFFEEFLQTAKVGLKSAASFLFEFEHHPLKPYHDFFVLAQEEDVIAFWVDFVYDVPHCCSGGIRKSAQILLHNFFICNSHLTGWFVFEIVT